MLMLQTITLSERYGMFAVTVMLGCLAPGNKTGVRYGMCPALCGGVLSWPLALARTSGHAHMQCSARLHHCQHDLLPGSGAGAAPAFMVAKELAAGRI